MDDRHDDGTDRQVAGSLKEAIGKLTGDDKTQAEGHAEKQDGRRRTDPATKHDLEHGSRGAAPHPGDQER